MTNTRVDSEPSKSKPADAGPDEPGTDRPLLPSVVWLWMPLALTVGQIVTHAIAPRFYAKYIALGETALTEIATPILLVPAVLFGLLIVRHGKRLPNRWLVWWAVVLTLGSVYFAGEELSWGQHWIGWESPDFFANVNRQGETNFHNTTSWANEKPRLLLELFVLVGGVLVPLIRPRQLRLDEPDHWSHWFWPARICIPIAVMISLVKIPDRIADKISDEHVPHILDYYGNEAQELLLANFMLVYLGAIYRRLRRG